MVEDDMIGCVVKSWADGSHDVYVRYLNGIKTYHEDDIKHFIYSKTLTEEETGFYS